MIESSSIKVSGSTATAVSVSQQPIQTQSRRIPKKNERDQSPPINNDHHIIESNITDHLPVANSSRSSPQTIQQLEQQNGYHHHPTTTTTISDEEKKDILAILHRPRYYCIRRLL